MSVTTRPDPVDFDGQTVGLRHIIMQSVGILVLLFGAIYLLSLATWNVLDPSINNATSAPVTNWMGPIGATISDMTMQLFGLASIFLAVPLFLLGLKLLRHECLVSFSKSLAWLLAIFLCSGMLSTLPFTQSWPLPVGLGGAVGEIFLLAAYFVTGTIPQNADALIYGAILAVLLVACVRYALMPQSHPEISIDTEQYYEECSRGQRLFTILPIMAGGIMHGLFSLFGLLKRSMNRAKNYSDQHGDEDWYESVKKDARSDLYRVEPKFVAEGAQEAMHAYDDIGDRTAQATVKTAPPHRPKIVQARKLKSITDFDLPPLELLTEPQDQGNNDDFSAEKLEQNAQLLESVLEDFGVKGQIINVRPGPVVTLYELEPAPGIKSSRVIGLADDIARSMSAISVRVAVVPGRNVIGIEMPNQIRETVYLREMLGSRDFAQSKGKLDLCLGKTIGGEAFLADLARMPHLLIAGTTGSGKSVAVNTMILSLLYRMTPEQCRLIMIDPKMLELSIYDGIPHLLTPVVTDPAKAVTALKWAVREMDDRYKKMSKVGVRNIDGFNERVSTAAKKGKSLSRTVQTGFDPDTGEAIYETEDFDLQPLPYIVIIVDEMADLMMVAGKDIEGSIQRLAQKARAAGVHLITATQRPSVDVITGTIKANFPTRISFQVTSKIDSRTILGEMGAEQLLGQGDMLYMAGGGRISRLHGPFVSDQEAEYVANHLKAQGTPDYLSAVTEEVEESLTQGDAGASNVAINSGDALYDKAVNIVLNDRKASTSYIQRRLSIGYNRAATLIERMEQEGVISAANHAGKREVLVGEEDPI